MASQKISRREFLKFVGLATGASLLAGCAPQVVEKVVKETQIVEVEKEKIVEQTKVVEVEKEKIVEATKIVEKEVEVVITATPEPALVTPQGRTLPMDAAPLDKQIYREAGAEPKFFDTVRDIYSSGGINMVSEPLLRNNENIETVPALAESWTAGPDATTGNSSSAKTRSGAMGNRSSPMTSSTPTSTWRTRPWATPGSGSTSTLRAS